MLSVDLSAPEASLAWFDPESGTRDVSTWVRDRSMTQALFHHIQVLLSRNGKTTKDAQLLVNGQGPGNFSGMRAGQAALEGLALPSGTPVVGVSSGRAVALDAFEDHADLERLAVLGDARRGKFWVGLFARAPAADLVTEWQLVPYPEIVRKLEGCPMVIAPEFERTRHALEAASVCVPGGLQTGAPRAEILARIALEERTQGRSPEPLAPLYLHPAVETT